LGMLIVSFLDSLPTVLLSCRFPGDDKGMTCSCPLLTKVMTAFSSTLDFPTLWRTTVVTGREMIRNLMMGKL
jgi:hypothetical protein